MIWLLVIILAAVFGSFANVLVYRLPLMILNEEADAARTFNLSKPASHCPSCKQSIKWWQNLPLLSYIALRGRCQMCASKIPLRYFLIELGSAFIGAACFWRFGWSVTALMWFVFFYGLWVAAWIDAAHFLLPDVLTLTLLWVALVWKSLAHPEMLPDAVLGAALGYVMLRAVYEIHYYFTQRHGLGFGDMKLLAAIGAWLGVMEIPNVMLLACVLGLVYALYAKLKSNAQVIPLGPFLGMAAVIDFVVLLKV